MHERRVDVGLPAANCATGLSRRMPAETRKRLLYDEEVGGGGQGNDGLAIADLIAHLRDLLVFKVKPDALTDEGAPELQSSLGKEAALIETDRLLELIEQFAEAEGRMKWAPNKKLHFEVAVIEAIQTLSQVTLTEVIDNLAALRGGRSRHVGPKDHRPSWESHAREKESFRVSRREGLPSPPRPLPGDRRTKAPPTFQPPRPPQAASIDMTAVSPKAVQLAYTRRPLIKTWIESARLCGTEGRNVLLGFAPDQKTIMESLSRPGPIGASSKPF